MMLISAFFYANLNENAQNGILIEKNYANSCEFVILILNLQTNSEIINGGFRYI